MRSRKRREFLGLVGGSLGVALAGCSDEEGEFLVTNARLVIQRPESVRVRVTIENATAESQTGTLQIRLAYHADGDTESTPDETWTKSDDVSVKRGSSPLLDYSFESSYRDGADATNYTTRASIDAGESEPD